MDSSFCNCACKGYHHGEAPVRCAKRNLGHFNLSNDISGVKSTTATSIFRERHFLIVILRYWFSKFPNLINIVIG